jgi:hypothetical protein
MGAKAEAKGKGKGKGEGDGEDVMVNVKMDVLKFEAVCLRSGRMESTNSICLSCSGMCHSSQSDGKRRRVLAKKGLAQ